MKRTPLTAGQAKVRAFVERGRESSARSLERSSRRAGAAPSPSRSIVFSPASKAQREKARTEPCVVTQAEAVEGARIDPAHLWPRGKGGCDDPLCVVPLERIMHRRFDDGELDLLPYLVGRRTAELCHALEHADGDLLSLLHRLTGQRHYPTKEAA